MGRIVKGVARAIGVGRPASQREQTQARKAFGEQGGCVAAIERSCEAQCDGVRDVSEGVTKNGLGALRMRCGHRAQKGED
jgi:hypothetical protein